MFFIVKLLDVCINTIHPFIEIVSVPDILDHRQDSSTSNETTPEMDCLPSSKRENNRERRPRTRRIALHSVASIDRFYS